MKHSNSASWLRLRVSLRSRFLLSILALVLVLLSGFVYAVSEFLDVVENDVIHGELMRDMDRVVTLYKRDPTLLEITEPGLRVFVTSRGDSSQLPDRLAGVDSGHSREIRIPNSEAEYAATRRDVGSKSIYVLRDMSKLEQLEKELIGVAWIVGLGSLFLAVLLAFWLSTVVVRPVRALAARLSRVVPGEERPALRGHTGDHQLDVIVKAFEHVLDRFDAFVAREQAFTEDASHELRTPLAIAMSAIDLISADRSLSSKSHTRLLRARQATTRMQELIEALLLLARAQPREDYSIAVSPIVREAIAMQQHAFDRGDGTAMDITFDVRDECQVAAPESMLLSLVSNLLRNAIEHGHSARIDVLLAHDRLSITDHGNGMTPAVLSRVFDRRFSGEHSNGQGMGLYLVKRICERFDWHVDVCSTPEVGTCFRLHFNRCYFGSKQQNTT